MTGNNETYIYRIDNQDIIRSVSDNWLSFAVENDGLERNSPENVIGTLLWDFVTGNDVRYLYNLILQQVRENNKSATLQFRCDSPELCRYLQLVLIPLEDGGIEFQSQILRTESRDYANILDTNIERSYELVKICSICKKVEVPDSGWEETDTAVNTLKLFESELLPRLTHGLCDICFDVSMAEVRRSFYLNTANTKKQLSNNS